MSDDRSTFEVTRARLEDIVVQVRRKDVSLEQSLDLLEEAVRLVNRCNDLIDQTSFRAASSEGAEGGPEGAVEQAEGESAQSAEPEAAAADEVDAAERSEPDDADDAPVAPAEELEDDERS